jgi:hypothetical protein
VKKEIQVRKVRQVLQVVMEFQLVEVVAVHKVRLVTKVTKATRADKGDPGTGCTSPCTNGADGITPTISVDEIVGTGPAAVSVARTGNDYKLKFTLPAVVSNAIDANSVDR